MVVFVTHVSKQHFCVGKNSVFHTQHNYGAVSALFLGKCTTNNNRLMYVFLAANCCNS